MNRTVKTMCAFVISLLVGIGTIMAEAQNQPKQPRPDLRPAPTTPAHFTCDSQSGVCKCDGFEDCYQMGKAKVCAKDSETKGVGTITCTYKDKDLPIPEGNKES
jgi:hypothetical protein